jgi:transposase
VCGIESCISPKSKRKTEIPFDQALYKSRHKIENYFGKLKDWRRMHTLFDRFSHASMSGIAIAATIIFWINQ